MGIEGVEEALARLPRLRLGQLPTPLQFAPRLSQALGGPKIYFKRDDLSGPALGGNKVRMFEYVLPRVLASGADCVVAAAAVQSNYCRQLAACCAQAGLEAHLVLRQVGPLKTEPQGNLLLDLLLGARVYVVQAAEWNELYRQCFRLVDRLRAQGRQPYVLRAASDDDLGLHTAGYVACAVEMHKQFEEAGLKPDAIYLCSGDTTQGGLALGAKALGETYRVFGANLEITDSPREPIVEAGNAAAEALGLETRLELGEVENSLDYVGEGYGVPTPEGVEAIRLAARLEGIVLDPVYTSKGLAALIDHVRTGRLTSSDTVVFMHTGGLPGVFTYAEHFFQKESLQWARS